MTFHVICLQAHPVVSFRGAVLGTRLCYCALDLLVEVIVEGTSSRTVCSGSLCSSDFGGHPC